VKRYLDFKCEACDAMMLDVLVDGDVPQMICEVCKGGLMKWCPTSVQVVGLSKRSDFAQVDPESTSHNDQVIAMRQFLHRAEERGELRGHRDLLSMKPEDFLLTSPGKAPDDSWEDEVRQEAERDYQQELAEIDRGLEETTRAQHNLSKETQKEVQQHIFGASRDRIDELKSLSGEAAETGGKVKQIDDAISVAGGEG